MRHPVLYLLNSIFQTRTMAKIKSAKNRSGRNMANSISEKTGITRDKNQNAKTISGERMAKVNKLRSGRNIANNIIGTKTTSAQCAQNPFFWKQSSFMKFNHRNLTI